MKKMVQNYKPSNIKELKAVLRQVWEAISIETINSLVASFFNRLQLVIMNKGESIQPFLRNKLSLMSIATSRIPEDFEPINDLIAGLEMGLDFPYTISCYNNQPFTEDEKLKLVKLVLRFGQKWEIIARLMQNRSPYYVKNIYNAELKGRRMKISFY